MMARHRIYFGIAIAILMAPLVGGCAHVSSESLFPDQVMSLSNTGHHFEYRRRAAAQFKEGRVLCIFRTEGEPAVLGRLMSRLQQNAKLRPSESLSNIALDEEWWFFFPLWCAKTSTVTADVYYLQKAEEKPRKRAKKKR
jgi:hypothetical protein